MTKIWNENGFVSDDVWVVETDDTKAGEGQKPLLPLADFLQKAEMTNEGELGVLLSPADDVTALQPYLDRLAIVVVTFPAFADGRGFSQAALLRTRLGFEREIRAIGDVLIDKIPLMQRCGITSFAVSNETAIARLDAAHLPGISLHYQPTAKTASGGEAYSWRRRAAF
jgi:uncharacterized protein (DUF934 family)